MALEFTVCKQKGSSQYYVCKVGEEKTMLSRLYATKKKALHYAAELEGMNYKEYMNCRRKDGVTCD
jgi:hypothetical protein